MTTIITKNGSGAPTAGQLSQGELAVDLTNKELYTKDSGGNVIKVGAQGGSTGTFTDLTATSSFTSPGIDDNANATAITIDASENVGIGTDPTTTAKLEIDGTGLTYGATIKADTNASLGVFSTAAPSRAVITTQDGISAIKALNGPGASALTFETGSSGTSSEAMRIDAAGSVSIGTSNSLGILTLKTPASDDQDIITITEDGINQAFSINGNFAGAGSTGNAITLDSYWANDIIAFRGDGNVGIGTTAPSSPLTVNGDIELTGGPKTIKNASGFLQVGTTGAHDLTLLTDSTERMRIDSSGRVGIGTSSPTTFSAVNANNLVVGSGSGSEGMTIYSQSNAYGGLAFADGTASNEQYAGLVQYDHTNNNLNLFTNALSRMTIDSSGNVGIGSPGKTLTALTSGVNSGPVLAIGNTDTAVATGDTVGSLTFLTDDNSYDGTYSDGITAQISAVAESSVGNRFGLSFYTGNASGTPSRGERMRLDSDGNLLVGTTSGSSVKGVNISGATATHGVQVTNTAALANGVQAAMFLKYGNSIANLGCYKHSGVTDPAGYLYLSDGNVSNFFIYHHGGIWKTSNNSAAVGTSAGTIIGTQTSDERLKDIEPTFEYGIDHVMQLNPIAYTRNDEEAPVRQLGFGAQSTQTVVPEAVYDTGECIDGYNVDLNDPMAQTPKTDNTKLAMEYVQLIPVLTKAIQEQQAMIETLQAEVAALKGA